MPRVFGIVADADSPDNDSYLLVLPNKDVFGTLQLRPGNLDIGVTPGVYINYRPDGQPNLEREVVLKRLEHKNLARHEYALQRKAWKATRADKTAARVPKPLTGVFKFADGPYALLMERIPGAQSLGALLVKANEDRWPIRKREAQIVRPALSSVAGLLAAFSGNLEHHDLHLGNIVQGGSGRWWVIDYGRAKEKKEGATAVFAASDLRMTFLALHDLLRKQRILSRITVSAAPATFYANKVGERVKALVRHMSGRQKRAKRKEASAMLDALFYLDDTSELVRLTNQVTHPLNVRKALSSNANLKAAIQSDT